jgi:hypothetical protein
MRGAAILFEYNGRTLDTDQMRPFPTQDAVAPTIFVTAEGDCFLLRHRQPDGRPLVAHMHHLLLLQFIKANHLEELRQYLRSLNREPL